MVGPSNRLQHAVSGPAGHHQPAENVEIDEDNHVATQDRGPQRHLVRCNLELFALAGEGTDALHQPQNAVLLIDIR